MRKFLKRIHVIQEKQFYNTMGREYQKKRLNPYHPLSYLTIFIVVVVAIVLFGVIGFYNQIEWKSFSFKYR